MREYDGISIPNPQYVGKERYIQLQYNVAIGYKSGASLADDLRVITPEYQAYAYEREKFLHGGIEDRAKNEAESSNQYAHINGEPKRADPRSPVALGDVLPPEQCR
jgi:hypothetical protein